MSSPDLRAIALEMVIDVDYDDKDRMQQACTEIDEAGMTVSQQLFLFRRLARRLLDMTAT